MLRAEDDAKPGKSAALATSLIASMVGSPVSTRRRERLQPYLQLHRTRYQQEEQHEDDEEDNRPLCVTTENAVHRNASFKCCCGNRDDRSHCYDIVEAFAGTTTFTQNAWNLASSGSFCTVLVAAWYDIAYTLG
ncbi:hypothetical protein [Alicyclobacillus sacchari]|uniref:hypothetical protein n=1 Tax=Alicyclobacillus sacchari TaxID=392010 RepID=UPI0024E10ED6|nr:hypothetical protein [Alicyclobacillus sacchari]